MILFLGLTRKREVSCVLIPYQKIEFIMLESCPAKYLILKRQWKKISQLNFFWSCKMLAMMQTNFRLQILFYSSFKNYNNYIGMSTQEALSYPSITHQWHNTHDSVQENFCRHSVGVAAGLNKLLIFPAEPCPPAIAFVVLGLELQLKDILCIREGLVPLLVWFGPAGVETLQSKYQNY